MKISGFTLVRHGVRFDYPFIESISSLLPLVDELVINVGTGEDTTLQKVEQLKESLEDGAKIKIFQSEWPLNDPEKKKGGLILSEQTNLALDRCSGDWCIYLQADEVFHEDDANTLKKALAESFHRPEVEGILFDYIHLYGSFDVVQETRSAYRREVRAIRKSSGARSVGDAQSFRKADGSKLQVIRPGVRVFHYGWVRTPTAMKEKTYFMDQLYHGQPKAEDQASQTPHTGDNYRYKKFWGLKRFQGAHPRYMKDRLLSHGWVWDLENSPLVWSWKDIKKVVLDTFERVTGYRLFEYRSYKLIK